jgi:ribose transport system ATP-binding protein
VTFLCPENSILSIRNVSKEWPGVLALDNISLDFKKGEVHAIMGENGAGKSTLMKIIAGSFWPDKGRIVFEGKEYFHFDPKQAIELGISIIYQEFNLISELNVAENIFLGIKQGNRFFINKKDLYKNALELIDELGVELDPKEIISNLSPAYQQVVEILRSISRNVKLLIMDEPTASLTKTETSKLFELIQKLKAKGVTILYISHRLEEVFEISDRITVLRDGCLIATQNTSDISDNELVRLMVGRDLSNMYPNKEYSRQDKEILKITDLSQGTNLHNISFNAYKGEILGIGGLVGAGRTEMARCIFGADNFDNGTIQKNGVKLELKSPEDAIKAGIAYIAEDRKQHGVLLHMTVAENITLAVLKKISRLLFIDKKAENKIVSEYIQKLDIKTPFSSQSVKNLSGGNQQKVVIAKLLATESDVIILDEPTRGIDVGTKHEIYEAMNTLAKEGKVIIMISSDMLELLGVSDRVLVMRNGAIAGELSKNELSEEKVISLASGLTS